MAVPLRRSTGSEIGLLRPPPLVTSSAHTLTVSPSPKVLLVVEFASWITAPEINHNQSEAQNLNIVCMPWLEKFVLFVIIVPSCKTYCHLDPALL